MHITKDGRVMSEAECEAWFDLLCKCGHSYGDHYFDRYCLKCPAGKDRMIKRQKFVEK